MGAVATDTGPRARVNGAAGSSGSAGGPGGRSAGRARGRGWLFSGLGSRSRRLLAAALAAAIGTAFLATSIIMLSTANAGMAEAVSVGLSEADLVVTPGIDRADGSFSTADREALAALPEVDRVVTDAMTSMRWDDSHVLVAALPLGGLAPVAGVLPAAPGEVAVNDEFLTSGIEVGDVLTLRGYADQSPSAEREVRVVGVIEPPSMSSLAYGLGLVATDETIDELEPGWLHGTLLVQLADGVSESAGSAAISAELGDVGFESGAEAAQERVSDMTGETNVLGAILFGFAGVSLVTAAIVIANTFTITLAQRTEELALLRAVGATKRQVRRMVLLEAVVLGLLASIAGVLIGIALAAGLVALANRSQLDLPLGSGITVTRLAVLVPIAVGLVVTLLGALLPAARATRVSPLAAMRPDGHSEAAHRLPWVRLLVGLALLGVGCLAMVYAASSRDVFVGLLGGVVSFAGVLLALVAIVPALVRALGLLVRLVGVPGRIAVDNAVRNPGRAAATSAALLVGVTLITMTTIGAASAERTAVGEIDDKFAVDFVLANLAQSGDGLSVIGEDLEPDVPARVAEIAGVEASALVSTAYLRLGEQDWPTMAVGLEAADLEVLRSGEQAATLVPGTLGLSGQMQAIHGLPAGSTVLVSGPGGSRELSVVGLGVSDLLGLHAQDLQALAGETVRHGAVIVRAGEDANLGSVLRGLQDLASDGTFVQGQAVERAMITQILTVMVLIASALLGVAVLIALVGIANTLSLSVIERAREHALLRGLGLTRTQLRLTLLVEGVLFAVVASLIGIGLGVLYAWLGVQTVLPGHTDVRLALPMDRLLLIAGVAVVAGALASLLPARRAAKVSPVSGLVAT